MQIQSDDLRETLTYAQYVRPVLQSFGEERVCDAEDEARWRLCARRVLFELRVVDREVRPVVAAVSQRSNHAERQTMTHRLKVCTTSASKRQCKSL